MNKSMASDSSLKPSVNVAYTKFAEKCEGEARAAFLEIVREEAGHLAELKEKLGEG